MLYMLLKCSCENLNIPVIKISRNRFVAFSGGYDLPMKTIKKMQNLFLFNDWAQKLSNYPQVLGPFCCIFAMKCISRQIL